MVYPNHLAIDDYMFKTTNCHYMFMDYIEIQFKNGKRPCTQKACFTYEYAFYTDQTYCG